MVWGSALMNLDLGHVKSSTGHRENRVFAHWATAVKRGGAKKKVRGHVAVGGSAALS